MDLLTHVFLESPAWLGGLSFVAFAVVLLVRRGREGRLARQSPPVALLLIAVLFFVQKMVVTQRERIRARLDSFIAAIEQCDTVAVANVIDPGFKSEGMNREAIVEFISVCLRNLRVYDSRIVSDETRIDGDHAEMSLRTTATVRVREAVGERHWGTWSLQWQRTQGQWNISGIMPQMVDMVPMTSLKYLKVAAD